MKVNLIKRLDTLGKSCSSKKYMISKNCGLYVKEVLLKELTKKTNSVRKCFESKVKQLLRK